METFELYHKSGVRRTIRLKAWGLSKRGFLRTSLTGTPQITLDKDFYNILTRRDRGSRIIELEVTIKATKKTG